MTGPLNRRPGPPPPGTSTRSITLRGLTKDFQVGGLFSRRTIRALNDVSLDIDRGEIMALVGESGSGKSTIARCIIRLEQPTSRSDRRRRRRRATDRATAGVARLPRQGADGLPGPVRLPEPHPPRRHFLERSIRLHQTVASKSWLRGRLQELMRTVDLPVELLDSHAYELSGGQRQRISIARALAMEPQVILADEPTSMLDVSVRIGVLNLMRRLRDEQGISMLYITHDLASARYVADRTTVMFAGELVESGDSVALMSGPAHPYTQLLLSAVPDPERAVDLRPSRAGPPEICGASGEVMLVRGRHREPLQRDEARPSPRRRPGQPALGALPPLSPGHRNGGSGARRRCHDRRR